MTQDPPRKNEYREPGTGKYAYFGRFNRLCVCGHRLGVHIAGGFECGEKDCDCQKFKPTRKRGSVICGEKMPRSTNLCSDGNCARRS